MCHWCTSHHEKRSESHVRAAITFTIPGPATVRILWSRGDVILAAIRKTFRSIWPYDRYIASPRGLRRASATILPLYLWRPNGSSQRENLIYHLFSVSYNSTGDFRYLISEIKWQSKIPSQRNVGRRSERREENEMYVQRLGNFEILTNFCFIACDYWYWGYSTPWHWNMNTGLFILASVTRRAARESARCPRQ